MLSSTEQAVLAALKKKARITKVELQKETSFGKSTIDRAIKALEEKGLIERVGSNKTGYWNSVTPSFFAICLTSLSIISLHTSASYHLLQFTA